MARKMTDLEKAIKERLLTEWQPNKATLGLKGLIELAAKAASEEVGKETDHTACHAFHADALKVGDALRAKVEALTAEVESLAAFKAQALLDSTEAE